jgi:mono/diheme cytochrome c family protein
MTGRRFARRAAKLLLVLLAGAVALVAALAAYVRLAPLPRYPVSATDETVERTPERLRQGARIASMRCLDCHLDPVTGHATGRALNEIPGILGVSRSANITGNRESGIGAWTDGELMYTLRTGIARDGRLLPPWMPRLRRLPDEDLRALIAFLRSGAPAVEAGVGVGAPSRSEWNVLGRALFRFAWRPAPIPPAPIARPDPSDPIAYGKYVVQDLAECWSCHSGDFAKLDHVRPEKTKGYLAGGTKMQDKAGGPVVAANITPDAATGIGRWSEREFVRAIRDGIRPDGRPLRYPMAPYVELSEPEVLAVLAYLRTVPAIRSERVAREERPDIGRAPSDHGHALYAMYGCRACHGDLGVGMGDLRHAAEHFPDDAAIEAWIRHPSRLRPGTKMPDFDGIIRPEDFPALIKHVRSLAIASR